MLYGTRFAQLQPLYQGLMSTHSQKSKRIRIAIIDPPEGTRDCTSLAHARRYVARGAAEWVGAAIRFVRNIDAAYTPTITIAAFRPCDSGQSGFLRYPQPSELSTGLRFPVLARVGAGLG